MSSFKGMQSSAHTWGIYHVGYRVVSLQHLFVASNLILLSVVLDVFPFS